jgi:L-methionine (R)-S-oxide reductase
MPGRRRSDRVFGRGVRTVETAKRARYGEVRARLRSLLDGEDDWIASLATIACELHAAFDHFDWTGFYRVTRPEFLVVGPYQGSHGCLRIPFSRGVCGAAATTRRTQIVDDVSLFPTHIACSSATQSEIVVPVLSPAGDVLAVLDVDSNRRAAFTTVDQTELERICSDLGDHFPFGEATMGRPARLDPSRSVATQRTARSSDAAARSRPKTR